MQTKFNNYMNELNEIIHKLKSFPSFDLISSKDLKHYKTLISRKEFLQKTINDMLNKRSNIIGTYNDKNKKWLSSDMNCRKYYKLEQYAAYHRDLALHKAGFILKHPSPPFINQLKTFISEKFIQPISNNLPIIKNKINSDISTITGKSPIYQGIKKGVNYVKKDLPKSLTEMAILGTKKCIISYRNFSNHFTSFTRSISSSIPIRTLSFIINQAREQANFQQLGNQQSDFLSRVKVNPKTFKYSDKKTQKTGYYGNGCPVIPFYTTPPVQCKNNIVRTK